MKEKQKEMFWKGQSLEIVTSDQESYFTEIVMHDLALIIKRPVNKKFVPLTVENGMTVTVYFYNDKNELYTFDSNIYELQNKKYFINKPDSVKKLNEDSFSGLKLPSKWIYERNLLKKYL